ncbi:MAG: ABC transporter substrate-binding protein [Pseudomonadota bacterium]
MRRLFLFAPALVVLALVQAYFWVPTYDDQLRRNNARAGTYIEGSIGDAKFLNPILNSDTASSRITDLVFEGLLKLDEEWKLAPALARSYQVSEVAYLGLPEGVEPDTYVDTVRAAIAKSEADWVENVVQVRLTDPGRREVQATFENTENKTETRAVDLQLPPRLEFTLRRVDQDLAARLEALLGQHFPTRWEPHSFGQWPDEVSESARREQALAAVPLLEHNPVIEFRLRDGVRFHDGHVLDASDVRFTYDAIMEPNNLSPRRADFEPIASVQVLGPLHVRVTYKRLYAPALYSWTMGILPEHLLGVATRDEGGMRDAPFNRAPVGTGPMRFVEWRGDELITLEGFPGHWQGRPELERFMFRVLPDLLTQELEFAAGALDSYVPQPHQVERFAADERFMNFTANRPGYSYIAYNQRKAPFDDPRVRRALGMAIDVEEIVRYVLHGEGDRVSGPFPPGTPWTDPDFAPLRYDPEAARQLLAEAGFQPDPDGWLARDGKRLEFNLITNNGNPVRKAIMTIAQQAWADIGVKANTQVFEWAVFLKDFVNPGAFDALILGWRLGVDPDMYQLWHSSQTGFAKLNFTGYEDAHTDRLLERIRREYDRDRLASLTRELHRQIARNQPYTFLFARRVTYAMDRKWRMVEADGGLVPVRAARSGELFYHMRHWRKVGSGAAFSARTGQ